jgi:hypothetical protein
LTLDSVPQKHQKQASPLFPETKLKFHVPQSRYDIEGSTTGTKTAGPRQVEILGTWIFIS